MNLPPSPRFVALDVAAEALLDMDTYARRSLTGLVVGSGLLLVDGHDRARTHHLIIRNSHVVPPSVAPRNCKPRTDATGAVRSTRSGRLAGQLIGQTGVPECVRIEEGRHLLDLGTAQG